MNFKSTMSKFLTNKWVLNVVAFLALLNVIGYIVMGNINATLYFVVLALLVRYFSKNMIIVLGVPLLFVNLLVAKNAMVEGMENKKGDDDEQKTIGKNKDQEQKKMVKKINEQTSKRHGSLVTTPLEYEKSEEFESAEDINDSSDSSATDGFEPGRRKNKSYDIDYATTIEDAYDELNKILGSDGIQRLTSDTQGLMKQQLQLAEAMKGLTPVIQGMAPMMEQVKGMMEGMGDGKNGLGSVIEMAKKFSSPAK
jgi:hypothetical protein